MSTAFMQYRYSKRHNKFLDRRFVECQGRLLQELPAYDSLLFVCLLRMPRTAPIYCSSGQNFFR